MNPSIFKAYDIRGVYPQELDEKSAYAIGLGFAKYTKAKTIIVGEDARVSSPSLKKALIQGLSDAGAKIISTGLCATPLFYFAVASYNEALRRGSRSGSEEPSGSRTTGPLAGIMVTASHNPGKYNGFKLVWGDATPIEPKAILPIIKSQNHKIKKSKCGKITKINVVDAYVKKVLSLADVKKIKPMKVVVDTANGMAGITVPKLLARLPQIKTTELFFDIDMSFPNHEANPLKEGTLSALKKSVLKNKATLGIAYDGDADRIGFIDEKGKAIHADFIFAAILPELFNHKNIKTLKHKNKKTTFLYDLRCSKIVPETIASLGGKSAMTRVGHAFIKKDMARHKAIAAAELSSHYYFKNFYGVECSDLVLLYLLTEISRQNKPLSEIIKPFQKYYQSGEINFEVRDKDKIIAELVKKYKKSASGFSEIDGVRMEFTEGSPSTSSGHQAKNAWWWMSVRSSNTEPLLRLNMEASNKVILEKKLFELKKIIKS